MKINNLLAFTGLLISGSLYTYGDPTNTLHLDETFLSGATFSGNLTFDTGWDKLTAVDGLLSGSLYGVDPINVVWDPNANYASSYPGNFGGNFLMDGPGLSFKNFITVTWDYTNAPALVLSTPAVLYPNLDPNTDLTTQGTILSSFGGNNVVYTDPLVSGSFSTVPEGQTYAPYLAGLSLLGFGFLVRRKAVSVGI